MLDDLITSKTRVKLLTLFLEHKQDMFHVREIVRRVEEEINAVRRELLYLEKKGVLSREPRANRVYYYLNKNYLYYNDLMMISTKVSGLGLNIIKNRVKLGKIKYAMLSGKFSKGERNEDGQPVDMLIVGTIVLPELALLVRQEEAKRNHEINYTVMTEEEFEFRKKRRDPFISSVLYQSRIMLIGDEDSMLS